MSEFQDALRALGFSYSVDESRAIFHKSDEDENGVIDIDEFFGLFVDSEEEEDQDPPTSIEIGTL